MARSNADVLSSWREKYPCVKSRSDSFEQTFFDQQHLDGSRDEKTENKSYIYLKTLVLGEEVSLGNMFFLPIFSKFAPIVVFGLSKVCAGAYAFMFSDFRLLLLFTIQNKDQF
ncbi:hypothetical protein AVEN_19898-1 [Araneus ventricosus]|uniref:Uncharacterized protein n=1 Tax=Araneus ventricosus TaxID=182803 RepID=A0A4Y2J9Q4_ARAVE|nr:hypothetical protein AVEN_19898-1 [Araneus ventricosus]